MDASAIPCNDFDRSVPRDQGALHHQSAVWLTHEIAVERRQIHVNAGLSLGNMITDSGLSKEEKKKQKKAAKEMAKAREKSKRIKKKKSALQR